METTREYPVGVFGIAAEFKNEDEIISAAKAVYGEGYRKIETYSPLPVHGLPEAIG